MKNITNKVRLIGHIGNDPQITSLNNGSQVLRLSIATNQNYRGPQGEPVHKTEWHQLCAWGNTAIKMHEQVSKGTQLIVDGKLNNRSYNDRNGNMRSISEILVQDFAILAKYKPMDKTI